ncbi:acyltransferase family protein [Nocardioides sp. KR10-350]|uniref:acyltransferase family protein n=1 Tax=Nocardioides cheoyonin TaxID=3156615 RepID=UPI0032B50B9B
MTTMLDRPPSASGAPTPRSEVRSEQPERCSGVGPRRLRERVAALDGLRGLAVLGVIGFHTFPDQLPGGFVGVDVFFVLSGFLITGGLLRRDGRGAIGRFWLRRARRLLPALVAMVLACGLGVLLVGGDPGVGFGGQLAAAAGFVTNWHLVATGSSYFSEASPPVLQHLWSLAVEEQFYVVWPLALLALSAVVRRWGLRPVVAVVAALAAASVVAAGLFAAAGETGRAYYGTDSHAFGLLAGAVLALARERNPVPRGRRPDLAGAIGLLGLLLACLVLTGDRPTTYAVGLPAVVGLTVLVVACVTRGGPLARALSVAPLRRIGLVSYGLYLWHWPVLVLLRYRAPVWTHVHPVRCAVVAVLLTAAAATASYLLLERPIQRDGFREYAAGVVRRLRWPGPARIALVTAGVVALACVGATAVAALRAPQHTVAEAQILAGQRAIAKASLAASHRTAATPTAQRRREHARHAEKGRHRTPLPLGPRLTAVGDSVMLASAPGLLARFPGISIDAKVSRQAGVVPGILRDLARHHRLRPVVMVGVGTNGPIPAGTLEAIRRILGPKRELVLVNVYVDRPWAGGVNRTLASYAAHARRTRLVDWRSAIAQHQDLLGPDHIHPGPSGGRLYAATVAAALR